MFKKTVETIVGGTIGLFALYAVARLSYSVGYDAAKLEQRYEEMSKNPPEEKAEKHSTKQVKNSRFLSGARKIFGIEDPEIHIKITNKE